MLMLVQSPFPRNAFADAPGAYVAAGVLLVAGVAGHLRLMWLLRRSGADRVDLALGQRVDGDRYSLWQKAVLDPRSYVPGTGERWIRRIVATFAVHFLSLLAAVAIVFFRIL